MRSCREKEMKFLVRTLVILLLSVMVLNVVLIPIPSVPFEILWGQLLSNFSVPSNFSSSIVKSGVCAQTNLPIKLSGKNPILFHWMKLNFRQM